MCGAGGLVLGFKMAMPEAEIICIDIDEGAVRIVHRNLKNDDCHAICADANHLPIRPTTGFDIIIAGTPCQGFSAANVNRRTSPSATMRRDLCHTFARIVTSFQPPCFVMENVEAMRGFPEYMNALRNHFKKWGYFVTISILDAVDYGVPQYRRRMIVMGSVFEPLWPPSPTHSGYCPKCGVMVEHWAWTIEPGFVETIYVCPKCRRTFSRGQQLSSTGKDSS